MIFKRVDWVAGRGIVAIRNQNRTGRIALRFCHLTVEDVVLNDVTKTRVLVDDFF